MTVRDQGKGCGVIDSVTGERSGGEGPWCTETELGSKMQATCLQLCLGSEDCVGIVWSGEYAAEQGKFYCCQCSLWTCTRLISAVCRLYFTLGSMVKEMNIALKETL